MGIDVYLNWKGKTEKEEEDQVTGWSTEAGSAGYLREAYHGSPYATQILVPEAFEDENAGKNVSIFAKELRANLDEALKTFKERVQKLYPDMPPKDYKKREKSFIHFVELAEKKEKETGEPCTIYASY